MSRRLPRMLRSATGNPSMSLRLVATLGLCLIVLDPAFPVRAQDGSVAAIAREHFEAGRAHLARGDSTAAHTAWRHGLEALDAEDAFDVRLADAYLRSVFRLRRDTEQAAAAHAYLQLIGRAGDPSLSTEKRHIVQRHVVQMVFLLPEAVQARITPDPEALMRDGGSLLPAAGERLAAWWRRQDALPASLGNERVVEHLERVTYAEQHFADARRLARFDERGTIYVRLGTPTRIAHLDNEAIEMDGLCAFCEPVLSGGHFVPGHEFWVYDALGVQYLFVKRNHRYVIGTVRDLLPQEIRGPTYAASSKPSSIMAGNPGEGQPSSKKAGLALKALRDYYDQMARYQPEYLALLNTIENDLFQHTPPGGFHRRGYVPAMPVPEASRRISEMRRLDRRLAAQREETAPPVRTEAVDEGNRLPVAARTARFLEDDGTTRTEVYWGVDPADLTLSPATRLRLLQHGLDAPADYDLQLTAVQYDAAYRAQTKHRTEHVVSAASEEPTVYSLALPGTPPPAHLALQWDQHTRSADDAGRAFIRTGTQWIDSIRALPTHPNALVLSDLVPLRTAELDADEPVRDDRGFRVTPYPFDAVTPDTKLALYVEAYHLTPGPDDRTRYTIEYAITRRHQRGGLTGFLLGGDESGITSMTSSHTGTSRTAREYTVIDLSAWKEADTLHMTVRVTDDVTGQRAARSLTFTLTE